jgi:hypothetical protein
MTIADRAMRTTNHAVHTANTVQISRCGNPGASPESVTNIPLRKISKNTETHPASQALVNLRRKTPACIAAILTETLSYSRARMEQEVAHGLGRADRQVGAIALI